MFKTNPLIENCLPTIIYYLQAIIFCIMAIIFCGQKMLKKNKNIKIKFYKQHPKTAYS